MGLLPRRWRSSGRAAEPPVAAPVAEAADAEPAAPEPAEAEPDALAVDGQGQAEEPAPDDALTGAGWFLAESTGAEGPAPAEPPVLVLTRTSPEGRSREQLAVVAGALDDAAIDYWYVPAPQTPGRTRLATLALPDEVLGAVLPALDEHWNAVGWDPDLKDWVESVPGGYPQHPVQAFYATVKDPRGRRRIGISSAVEVETWTIDGTDPRAPCLLAPRNHPRGRSIPIDDEVTQLTVRGRELLCLPALLAAEPTQMVQPIDAVITWVDSADPEYLARRAQWLESGDKSNVLASGAARTRSLDELRYLLRSIDMYAPFLRHIYLVTDGQVPTWLDTERDDLTVVDHTEIIKGALPTFNSHVIEANLHRIEGLAEHYVYFNDDTMLATRVAPEDFFDGSGRILFQPSGEFIGAGPAGADEAAPGWAGRNVRSLLERDFGRTITHKLRHVPHPQRRSIAAELAERYPHEWQDTCAHRWRDNTDIAPIQLHLWFAMLTGRASAAKVDYRYVELSDITKRSQLTRIGAALKATSMFCLNLRTEPQMEWEELEQATKTLLTRLYPFQGRFEREADATAFQESAAEDGDPESAGHGDAVSAAPDLGAGSSAIGADAEGGTPSAAGQGDPTGESASAQ